MGSGPVPSGCRLVAMLMRYPRRPGSLVESFVCSWTQRRANSSRLIPGFRLRNAISFTMVPLLCPLPLHGAERQTADEIALKEDGQEDTWQRGGRRQRGQLAPQDPVASNQPRKRHGERLDVRLREDKGEDKLIPCKDEYKQSGHGDPGYDQGQRDFP